MIVGDDWNDDNGDAHDVEQGEGGEQGDPLMPALFCLGMHPALDHIARTLPTGERIFAYLDDVYVVAPRDRVRQAYDIVAEDIRREAGIEINQGKTECWSAAGGDAPPTWGRPGRRSTRGAGDANAHDRRGVAPRRFV